MGQIIKYECQKCGHAWKNEYPVYQTTLEGGPVFYPSTLRTCCPECGGDWEQIDYEFGEWRVDKSPNVIGSVGGVEINRNSKVSSQKLYKKLAFIWFKRGFRKAEVGAASEVQDIKELFEQEWEQ